MRKKIFTLTVAICLLLQLSAPAVMAEKKGFFDNSIILLVGSPMCFVNGKMTSVGDVSPTVINDRTLVPVRFLTESFDGSVDWNGDTKTATLTCGGNTIDVPIGENKIVINGKEKALDVGACVISDRTMLPVRAISEALGKEVGYDSGIISLQDSDVEKYDSSSPYSKLTMDAIRKALSFEKSGKKIVTSTKFSFEQMIENAGCLMFYEEDIPYVSKPDSYVVTGNIYIENLHLNEQSKTEYKLNFDAYNYDYVYGIAEVYDAEGNLLSYKMIAPFGGSWTNLAEYGVAVYNMGVGISDWVSTGNSAYFTYRNQTQTQHTPIELTVPKDGYVYITSNPAFSQTLCTYDTTKLVTESLSTAISTIGLAADDDVIKSFSQMLEDKVSDTLKSAFASDPELYAEIIEILSKDIDATRTQASAAALSQKVLSLLTAKGLNLMEEAEKIAINLLADSGEEVLKQAAALFVDKGIGKALDSMSWINSTSNYICFMMDMHYSLGKRSLVLEMCKDDLAVYMEKAVFPAKTIAATSNGFVQTTVGGEKRTLVSGNYAYKTFVTDGKFLYYYNKNTLSVNCFDIAKGTEKKVCNVFTHFDSYYTNDWDRDLCLSSGVFKAYNNGKIYFSECGGYDVYPISIIDIKTGGYQLSPLRNVGSMALYGDKMYYMPSTGSFDPYPLYTADWDGTSSYVLKNKVWMFELFDNILYYCTAISDSYSDYDKGNVYKLNLDTNEETLIAENIKPSTTFRSFVAEYHANK